MHIASSLPPAPAAAVRAVTDRLLSKATDDIVIPALQPAITRAKILMAQAGLALTILEERRIREALEDVHTAIVHTLARLEQR
jgi:hypothetical protein